MYVSCSFSCLILMILWSPPPFFFICHYIFVYLHVQADQSGTIVDILVDDGKPVSVDTVSIRAILTNKSPVILAYAWFISCVLPAPVCNWTVKFRSRQVHGWNRRRYEGICMSLSWYYELLHLPTRKGIRADSFCSELGLLRRIVHLILFLISSICWYSPYNWLEYVQINQLIVYFYFLNSSSRV